ncbi:amino acid adenylation domain-containing protein [Jannaschia sp. 2305UL9-9]|uniref:amino acid adenylation domain-containing protein n=1 Tax=Jannaschia sp. 2305UL9-9 TaxID=3121638 RepID=UPI0035288D15
MPAAQLDRIANRDLFTSLAAQAEDRPESVALIIGETQITYATLHAQARHLAARLVEGGVVPGQAIGLFGGRSADAVIGLFGILGAGGVVVPLDPDYAAERLEFIRRDAGVDVIVCAQDDAAAATALGGQAAVFTPDGAEAPLVDLPPRLPSDRAFLLYTSGSTGTPKGVILPHRAAASLETGPGAHAVGPGDIVLHASTLACDGMIAEVVTPILRGASVAIVTASPVSASAVADVILSAQVTVVPGYAGLIHLIIDSRPEAFAPVRMLAIGGEAMSIPRARALMDRWPDITIINEFGPTETCCASLAHIVTRGDLTAGSMPIGRPLRGEDAFVLTPEGQPASVGTKGQLAIAGSGLALGYHDRADLSDAAFVPDPRAGRDGLVYLTGDVASRTPDGVFHFHGRMDRQTKIAGRRVELDGIEAALRAHPAITDAIVELPPGDGHARLVAFVIPVDGTATASDLRANLMADETLDIHPHVFPRDLVLCDDFPLTRNGKVDRRALATRIAPANTPEKRTNPTDHAAIIAAIWQDVLGGPAPAPSDSFFDLGGTSLQLIEAHAKIEAMLGTRFDIALMFDTPRLSDLAARLSGSAAKPAAQQTSGRDDRHDIAVVGMAARLPGIDTLEDFWRVITEGRSTISRFDADTIEDDFDAATRARSDYVPARAILDNVDQFDPKFFGMLPAEAARLDPQGRIFLELAQQALDDAGLDPTRAEGRVGVFAGSSMSTYLLRNLLRDADGVDSFTSGFQIDYTNLAGNVGDDIPARTAQKLGLTGPAMSVTTACSTGLVAVIQACEALRAGRIGAALAGGVSITFPQRRGYLAQEGGMVSLDGTCRPFDAEANGTVFGDGAGIVVLKRLSDALADGDTIHAVVRGLGQSNDGGRGMSYTAPSVTGQAEAIAEAIHDAGLTPSDIGYVECHGTATPLGDPVEIAGLKQAFGPATGQRALGAVKGNLGHLDAAAGIAGFIKAVLVLRHAKIPPVAHHRTLNPRIDLGEAGFEVPTTLTDWQSDGPRRAGVSAFGVGGSNAHVVLEEAPARDVTPTTDAPLILPLSAKTPEGLTAMANELADRLERQDVPLPDVAHTLQTGRRVWSYRGGVVARNLPEAVAGLRRMRKTSVASDGSVPLVGLMPGQGAQYPGMAAVPYRTDATFRREMDAGLAHLPSEQAARLRRLLLEDPADFEADAATLAQTRNAQPALLLTEVATARMWRARGLTPDLYIGHSVGEIAAAVLTGVMAFADALRFVSRRGDLMQAQAAGGMTAVSATVGELADLMPGDIDLAARNGPEQQVVAGPTSALDHFETVLTQAGVSFRRLRSSHAFHSRMMDPVIASLTDLAREIPLQAPDRPILSTVTGRELSAEQATDATYWGRQARACVDFRAALSELADRGAPPVMLEIGPGRTLTALTAQCLSTDQYRDAQSSLPDPSQADRAADLIATTTLRMWQAGLPVTLSAGVPEGARKTSLPSYPFARQRCWIDASPRQALPPISPAITGAPMTESPAAKPTVLPQLLDIVSEMSGMELTPEDAEVSFLELGLDSLFLGQLTQEIGRTFKVQFGFRRLTSDLGTPEALAAHILSENPSAAPGPAAPAVTVAPTAVAAAEPAPMATPPAPAGSTPVASGDMGAVVQAQLAAMQAMFAQQLSAMGGQATAPAQTIAPVTPPPAPAVSPSMAPTTVPEAAAAPAAKPSSGRRIKMISTAELTDPQKAFARDLAARYSAKFPSSKSYTDRYRPVLADPRTAAGFHVDWKEMAFPIVAERAKGAYIHDPDGNDLVDLVNGFGQTAFGHAPSFVSDAVAAQLEKGYALGPQAERAGPLAEKFAKAVGHERVSFCNTGTEAVIAAVRAARTASGREKVVLFDKSYHGQHDEVLVKPGMGAPTALPSAPGIPRGALGNVVVLPFASDEALEYISANIDDLAAVVIEPVRSRYPATRPEQFVRDIKAITDDVHTALIIDEVVTGFRTHARGMQGVWGLQGDMAIYGKVVGGGLPIGVVAGDAKYMDALDGGSWSFGDDSRPEAMPTFVAGTFVRHPLVLAGVEATLDHMAQHGDRLWVETPKLLSDMAKRMRAALSDRGLPDVIEDYSSWLVVDLTEADPRATLLYPLMRLQGVHVMDGFCWFLTTEHGPAEVDRVVAAFEQALDTLLSVGILAEVATGPVTRSVAGPVPLTASQREIWMRHQLGGLAAAAFNESGTLTLQGPLDVDALRRAIDQTLARRDALRLRFARDGASFTVDDAAPVDLLVEDVSTDEMDAILAEDARRPFDLTQDAPIRLRLFRTGAEHHALVVTAHHIVLDGWSFGLILDDLAALYAAEVSGDTADLPPAPSFASHAQRPPESDASHAAFWKDRFADAPDLPDLPTDRPRHLQADRPGATLIHEIPRDVVDAVKKVGAKHGCTLFTATFAAMQTLIHRLSGATDIVIGVPTAAQQAAAPGNLVGHCVNFLPIRSTANPEAPVTDHLKTVRDAVFAALDHDGLTFGEILDVAQVPRRLDRLPLTEVEFNLEEPGDLGWPAPLAASFETNAKAAVTFDLFFNLVSTEDGLRIETHYASDLFDAATIAAWVHSYEGLLRAMAATPEASIARLPMVSADTTPAKDGADLTPLPACLGNVARARGTGTAIEASDGNLTHAQLWDRSGAFAAALQRHGVTRGDRVAINLARGVDLVPALLGTLRAGAVFVPLDPRQPDARLQKILSDAQPRLIVANDLDRFTLPCLTPAEVVAGTPQDVHVAASDPAYVIYTSGSTGTPKGVEVPHGALVNLLTSMIGTPGLSADDRLLAVTTAMFDISILELFGPVLAGGTVVVAPAEDVVDGFKLAARLAAGDITVMQATPTLWSILTEAGFGPAAPFRVWTGGEPLARDLADRLTKDGAEVWNLYGPTETTIWSSVARVEPDAPITLGDPVAHTELHVLDANGQPTAPGVVGELNIGGAGLALGYAGQPDRTANAFRQVSLGGQPRRLYATGDMARRLADGRITLLGRRDGQVKLRGFRIDLGEVEAALRAQPAIGQAAVDLRQRANGDPQLVGYVVGDTIDAPTLMRALSADLPDYMIPTAWVSLPALPQTANGKLDRKALPQPEAPALTVAAAAPAQTPTEHRLAAIWADVLGRDMGDVTATLLDLGADSLTIFRLAARQLAEGLELEARHLFEHPSIRALAAFHDARGDTPTPARPKLSAFRNGARRRATGGAA